MFGPKPRCVAEDGVYAGGGLLDLANIEETLSKARP